MSTRLDNWETVRQPTGRPVQKRPDLECTDCGDPCWENLYGEFACVNPECRRFGQLVPVPVPLYMNSAGRRA